MLCQIQPMCASLFKAMSTRCKFQKVLIQIISSKINNILFPSSLALLLVIELPWILSGMACELILQHISQCILSCSLYFIQLFYFSLFHSIIFCSILFHSILSHSIIFFFYSLPFQTIFFLFILVVKISAMLFDSFLSSNLFANCEYNSLGEACSLEQAVLINKIFLFYCVK